MPDHYKTLGVSRNADQDTIKSAYRQLARKYHPDKNRGDKDAENNFKAVQEAYQVVSDSDKRAEYDRYGDNSHQQETSQQTKGRGFRGFDIHGFEKSDIFDDIFNAGKAQSSNPFRRNQPNVGKETMTLTFEESVMGCSKTFSTYMQAACDACDGMGGDLELGAVVCPSCSGSGMVSEGAFIKIPAKCGKCRGKCNIPKHPCKKCSGSGAVEGNRTIKITIPGGVSDGVTIPVEITSNFQVALTIKVQKHKFFKREGDNIQVSVPVPFSTLVLGGAVEVPQVNGDILNLKIPAGTKSSAIFKMKDRGVHNKTNSNHNIGDLFCNISVQFPVNLSKDQKRLLQNFDDSVRKSDKNNPDKNWVQQLFNNK